MTEVWFYVSNDASDGARAVLLRRLLERAQQSTRHLHIHTRDENAAARLDQWLWQPNSSFLPHGLATTEHADKQSVVIGHGTSPSLSHDVLVNLDQQVPDFFSRFKRVVELVSGNEEDRQTSRERWKYYRDRGYHVTKHELG